MQKLTITRPDDWHLHLRDGDMLDLVAPHTAAVFKRAIIMPNLKPPVVDATLAGEYQSRIRSATAGTDFEPLMTIYLTDETTPETIREAKAAGIVAAKLYPAGATTNSAHGVTDIKNIYQVFEAMQEVGMLLLLHGEVTGDVDVFDREAKYIADVLIPLRKDFPELKVVLEHITTSQAADYVRDGDENIACTITPQHLLYNRNAIFSGGIRPHYYCLPILKREQHRQALVDLATSGHKRVFLGTDSAPHLQGDKESECGCAGCYSAYHALSLYLKVFEEAGAIAHFEAFASHNGPDYYGLPRNQDTITLVKDAWQIPSHFDTPENKKLVPLDAGQQLAWRVEE